MLSVDAAREQVLEQCWTLAPELMPLSSASLGRVLAEEVASDLDMPPFDKAMMDGYAVRSADLPDGKGVLEVVEEVTAGQQPTRRVEAGQAVRIMTGAPIPAGADAVIMLERTQPGDGNRVAVDDRPPQPGQHIQPQGRELAKGDVVLRPGDVLRAQEFGVLAMVGRSAVRQVPPPRVAIVATGDELIEPAMMPGPTQIRNSNATMVLAQAHRAGGLPRYLGIGRDRVDSLRPLIEEGLQTAHVLILTGGVSAGKLDLVPDALAAAGVTVHFHHVAMKPGKPLLFGSAERDGERRLVFGLPGNPVSALVCFELFVRPVIRKLAGYADIDLSLVLARLDVDFPYQSDRPTYYPARLEEAVDRWEVSPLPWLGSGDLRAFLRANALLRLPAGDFQLFAGRSVEVLRLE